MTRDPSRWSDRPPQPGTDEARAAERLAQLPPPRPLDPAAKERISARLRDLPPPRPLPRAGALGLAGLLLLGGTIGGVALLRKPVQVEVALPEQPVAQPRALLPAPAPTGVSPVPPPTVEAITPAVREPSRQQPRPHRPGRAEAPASGAAPPGAVEASALAATGGPSSLEREARSLAEIVRTLRERKDPASALAQLEVHRRAFPAGALGPEADVVELDARVAHGDRAAALALLGRLDPEHDRGLPRRGELLALWADLLAEDARCNRASGLYAQLLAEAVSPELQERALWGKAHCLGRDGDLSGVRAALEEYLRRFPEGRFAEDARRQLSR